MARFERSLLESGVRIVTENHSYTDAVAIGIWVERGTRDEPKEMGGISHFLEHMVFKGTVKRSSYEIAKSLEEVGGDLNAFTTREYTCYHATVLKDHWVRALDVLSDLVLNMKIGPRNFELEKSVILQEIAMSDDELDELIHDCFLEEGLKGHSLSKPILGTTSTIEKMTMKMVNSFYKKAYAPNAIIVAAAGNIQHSELIKQTERLFKNGKKKYHTKMSRRTPTFKQFRKAKEKPTEQTHLLIGMPTASFKDRFRFEAFVLNAFLGGGMTSTLYQSIRERKGLSYSIYSYLNTFVDFGLLNIYAASEPDNMKGILTEITNQMQLVEKLFNKKTIELFKTQVVGSLKLGSEDMENRMQSLGVNEMVFKKYKPVDEVISELKAVSVSSMHEFMHKYWDLNQVGAYLMGAKVKEMESWFLDWDFSKRIKK
jgi:predicted Zn-dependent peptidase